MILHSLFQVLVATGVEQAARAPVNSPAPKKQSSGHQVTGYRSSILGQQQQMQQQQYCQADSQAQVQNGADSAPAKGSGRSSPLGNPSSRARRRVATNLSYAVEEKQLHVQSIQVVTVSQQQKQGQLQHVQSQNRQQQLQQGKVVMPVVHRRNSVADEEDYNSCVQDSLHNSSSLSSSSLASDPSSSEDRSSSAGECDTPKMESATSAGPDVMIASVGYATLTTAGSVVAAAAAASSPSSSSSAAAQSTEEYSLDTFDPYLFIYQLPPLLPEHVSRQACIPSKPHTAPKVTLVLDLDETLVHCSITPIPDAEVTFPVKYHNVDYTVYVRTRPYLKEFFEAVSDHFEIVIFTASHCVYANTLLNILDPSHTWSKHRAFRDSCIHVEGNYLKELSVLGRDLKHTVIVDNSPHAFSYQLDNGIPIESWFDDRSDRELEKLVPFLMSIKDADDVRPYLSSSFKMKEKVRNAAMMYSSYLASRNAF